ncbi:HNH endonuclease [Tunturibacter empetritectus]|uniref:5-methylcytosine-specific restriction endonuclease McrA n=1 Tax=Tunturiibacter empetritectus TaxID=3069691 RepID=A0A7W8IF27_9BACT|nr:HNH endonuclease [Edaphobacter lichenicola]MBB5315991.1 5-methylcytosine-specific restriction endonuclease McrA [Edaphobacter lichenicola]
MAGRERNDLEEAGWYRVNPGKYRHDCNAIVLKNGNAWLAMTAAGKLISKHRTAALAAGRLEDRDPDFWSIGGLGAYGQCGGLSFRRAEFDRECKIYGFVFHLPKRSDFPRFLTPIFKSHMFGQALCVKCASPMTSLSFRSLSVVNSYRKSRADAEDFIACECGNPVWVLHSSRYLQAEGRMYIYERLQRRRKSLSLAGGKHTVAETRQILTLQRNRCIYCNVQFSNEVKWTKDHLLAANYGGSNWALNLVLACKSCNSRRGDIPFRTYCKLLGRIQNQRIMMHLKRRVRAIDFDSLADGAFSSFHTGLELHDPKHSRLKMILRDSATARRNAKTNKLLPRSGSLI